VSRLPVFVRILKDCTPEVASALGIIFKDIEKRKLENGKQPQRGEIGDSEIETVIIQALAPFQNTPGFEGFISKTNDYNQTLAHCAILFGYTNLLRRLVGWNIDLSIADVNGFTALHCAHKKGDRPCIDLLLEHGASETVLDALGRAPSHLMPFDPLNDYDTDMTSDNQVLEQWLDAVSLCQITDYGHGVSDSGEEGPVDNAGRACQGGPDQMNVYYPVVSASKAPICGSTSLPWSMEGIRIRKPQIRPDERTPIFPNHFPQTQELFEQLVDGSLSLDESSTRVILPMLCAADNEPHNLRPAGEQRSLVHLSVVDGFKANENGKAGWANSSSHGENPELRTLFFRLARLLALPLGQDEGNVGCVPTPTSIQYLSQQSCSMPDWIAFIKPLPPAGETVIKLRRETRIALDIITGRLPMESPTRCSGIKILPTGSVKNCAETAGTKLVEFGIRVYGGTTKQRYETVCARCENREGKKKGTPSLIDFHAECDVIEPIDGKVRVEFTFCCDPKDHGLGDNDYL
jgi:ankyrin repeat protein